MADPAANSGFFTIGEFAEVYKGLLQTSEGTCSVAVKILKVGEHSAAIQSNQTERAPQICKLVVSRVVMAQMS